MVINTIQEEGFQLTLFLCKCPGWLNPVGILLGIGCRFPFAFLENRCCRGKDISHLAVDQLVHDGSPQVVRVESFPRLSNPLQAAADQVERLEFFKADQAQLDCIVGIVCIVSDAVSGIDDLGFQQRRLIPGLFVDPEGLAEKDLA